MKKVYEGTLNMGLNVFLCLDEFIFNWLAYIYQSGSSSLIILSSSESNSPGLYLCIGYSFFIYNAYSIYCENA